jgi:hypothetical protein
MDKELKYLAHHVLRNSFYEDFSTLVNQYMIAAAGLDEQLFEIQLSEIAKVFSRNTKANKHLDNVAIVSFKSCDIHGYNHSTLFGALNRADAILIMINGKDVFERQRGEWKYIDE